MNLLLDTCAMIWCVSDPVRLTPFMRKLLVDPLTSVHVSAITCAEIACLADSGRIEVLPHWRTWFNRVVDDNGWTVLDIDLETIQEAFSLPDGFHRDPADRFIVAAARLRHMPVVTVDSKIRDYPHVDTLF